MTPAGTSNELDVQNEWKENTHTHTHTHSINIINDTLARSLEPVVTECMEHTIRTGTGEYYFPSSADHEQDWQPYPVDTYSAISDDHTYIFTYIHTVDPILLLPSGNPFKYSIIIINDTLARSLEPVVTECKEHTIRTGIGEYYFPSSADHEQDWQPYPVDTYSAISDDHTYIFTYIHTVEPILLLPSGNPFKCHEEVLYLQPMIPYKCFNILPPD